MKIKHTPGPWKVEGRNIVAVKGRNYPLAEYPQHGVAQSKIDHANARLMAAAPSMYGMLRGALGLTGYATWAESPKAFEKAARELLASIEATQ